MRRSELREQLFKLLFRVEFNNPEEMKEQTGLFFEQSDDDFSETDKIYIEEKYHKIEEKLPIIDELIGEKASGWTVERIGKVDLTIIRLAVYEMKYDDDVPVSVAINEAVELAKKFGQDESYSFVNGILAKIV